jgi:hypothetical protein
MKLRAHIAFALLLAAVAAPAAYSRTAANQSTRADATDVVSRYVSNQAQRQYGFVTENSASQNRVDLRNAYGPPDPWQYRFVTENSASQNRRHPVSPSSSGYRFITENSAGQNRLPSAAALRSGVPTQSGSFDWVAAAIGAAGTLALIMLATAALRGMHRTRRHEAPAS